MSEVAARAEKPPSPDEKAIAAGKKVSADRARGLNKPRTDVFTRLKRDVSALAMSTMLLAAGCGVLPGNSEGAQAGKSGPAQVVQQATPTPREAASVPPQTATPREKTATAIPTATRKPTSIPSPTEVKPTAIPTATPELPQFTTPEGKFYMDTDGLPKRFVSDDGKETLFDKAEMKTLQQKAIAEKQPQLITLFPGKHIERPSINPKPAEHPVLSEAPKDVLSEEQLKQHGITIVQGKDTKLFIRPNAFLEKSALERYNKSNPNIKLTIVLVDGPVVHSYFLQEAKYEPFRKYYRDLQSEQTHLPEYKQKQLNQYQSGVEKAQKELEEAREKNDKTAIERAESNILYWKTTRTFYENHLTEEQRQSFAYGSSTNIAGQYIDGGSTTFIIDKNGRLKPDKDGEDNVIFLAVGSNQITETGSMLGFNSSGRLDGNTYSFFGGKSMQPKPGQSFPNPAEYQKNPNASLQNGDYIINAPLGAAAHHEAAHGNLTRGNMEKDLRPTTNEYATDARALEELGLAWRTWEESKFTDDRGYPFVFSLPGGGFIVTQDPAGLPARLEQNL